MKRVVLMLVFLVAWSVAIPALHSGAALAGDQDTVTDGNTHDGDGGRVFDSFGAADDGGDGDPGDAGDGYGYTDDSGTSDLQGYTGAGPQWLEFLWQVLLGMQAEFLQ